MPTARSNPQTATDKLLSAAKFLVPFAVSAIIAYGAARSASGAREATTDARFSAVEQKVETLDSNVVPRKENEAHWQSIEDSQKQLQTDVRDVRETEKQILLKLTK